MMTGLRNHYTNISNVLEVCVYCEYNRQTNVMAGQELVRKMLVPAVATLCSIVVLSSDQSECRGAPGRDLQ